MTVRMSTAPIKISSTASNTEVQAYMRALDKAKAKVQAKDVEIVLVLSKPTNIAGDIVTALKVKANDIRFVAATTVNGKQVIHTKVESLDIVLPVEGSLDDLISKAGHSVVLIPSQVKEDPDTIQVIYPERICYMSMHLGPNGDSYLEIKQVGMLKSVLNETTRKIHFTGDVNHEAIQTTYETISALYNKKTTGVTVRLIKDTPSLERIYMLANIKTVDQVGFVAVATDLIGNDFLVQDQQKLPHSVRSLELRPYVLINGQKYIVNHTMPDILKVFAN
ncbi:hypothetical protein TH1_185 [Shewanella phage Thanatos-1]|nr:hypothetical protein TH1_185 [Shewanella phage Thanatos-1]